MPAVSRRRVFASSSEKRLEKPFKRFLVGDAHRLARRVHGENGRSDVHRAHGDEGGGDGAERRTAAAVGAVHEPLPGNLMLFGKRAHDGGGFGISRVAL